jgi:L-alanine-DL-glutamate epimerase-like enolase superfamily enzyme
MPALMPIRSRAKPRRPALPERGGAGAPAMGARRLTAVIERWPVAGAFTIARGAKTHVDVVVAEITEGDHVGRGEATPIYYHGETAETVRAQLLDLAPALAAGIDQAALAGLIRRGAARNALDAALWDLSAKQQGAAVWTLAGLAAPAPCTTAFTISLGDPARMEAGARAAAGRYPLLKLKLAGEGDVARVAAVHRGAPAARLIVDANESWTGRDVAAEAAALLRYGVELIEQPVAAGQDHLLDGVVSPIPLCADESCQDRADLPRCIGRYAAINIKLDKAGGLTEALALAADARAAGLDLMVGCMLSTSLGIAPAFLVAQQARWVDLDGPLLLAQDRPGGFRYDGGTMLPVGPGFWG